MRCRDRGIRRRGIAILKDWHPEACWDARLIAEIGPFIVDVEEEGVRDGEVVPESKRAVITRICEAPDKRNGRKQALVQLVQRSGGLDGLLVVRRGLKLPLALPWLAETQVQIDCMENLFSFIPILPVSLSKILRPRETDGKDVTFISSTPSLNLLSRSGVIPERCLPTI